MTPLRSSCVWLALLIGVSVSAGVRTDCEWLSGFQTRVPGSAEHARMQEELGERLARIEGVRVWEHRFTTLSPRYDAATLTVAGGPAAGTHRVYPLWPSLARLNTTPAEGISGPLVYVGECELENLPARSLRGCVAVAEMSADWQWRWPFSLGAKALILLGSDQVFTDDVHTHFGTQPVHFPRFYLPDGKLADLLRGNPGGDARVLSSGAWVDANCVNRYVLVPGTGEAQPALAVAVGVDSTGVVPDLAPGADAAVDVAFAIAQLERLAANPPPRPVLFAFVDAETVDHLGLRRFLAAASLLPDEREDYRKDYEEALETVTEDRDMAVGLAQQGDALAQIHRNRYKPLHRYVKDTLSPELNELDEIVPDLRLVVHKLKSEADTDVVELLDGAFGMGIAELCDKLGANARTVTPDIDLGPGRPPLEKLDALLQGLSTRRDRLVRAQNQLLHGKEPLPETAPIMERVWQSLQDQLERQVAACREPLERYEEDERLRQEVCDALGISKDARPVAFLLGVDLSDAGVAAGPLLWGELLRQNEDGNAKEFRAWLRTAAGEDGTELWSPEQLPGVDLRPFFAQFSLGSYAVGRVASPTGPAASFGVPAVSWATLHGHRLRVDTPRDRFEALNWKRLDVQIDAAAALVDAMCRDSAFSLEDAYRRTKWRRVWGTIVDQSLGDPVPRVPQEDYIVTLAGAHLRRPCAGIRQYEFCRSGADGRFRFESLAAQRARHYNRFRLRAYKLAEDGSIVSAVTDRATKSGLNTYVDIWGANPAAMRGMVFDCVEVNLPPLVDPAFLVPLNHITIMDALKGSSPRYLSVTTVDGQINALLTPEVKWQVLARAGSTYNRMLLLNLTGDLSAPDVRSAALGFDTGEPLPEIPELLAARDFWRLNQRRLRSFRKAGITSRAIDRLHARTKDLLAEAEAAMAADDGAAMLESAGAALANEVRAYQAVRNTANDVARAAIILLLGLLPFSIAMERLFFASPHIYRQIGVSAAVFTGMTSVLWSFHPAFRITSQPLIIVLAFVILFLSLMVVYMVIHRFEADLERMRSGRAEGSGASTSQTGLLMCAMTIGIATMRKRKLRTTLTALTIALITFALLCFTSTQHYQDHHDLRLRQKPTYGGLLLRQPAFRAFSGEVLRRVESMLAKEGLECVPRYWWPGWIWDEGFRVHVRKAGTADDLALRAALLLDPREDQVMPVREVLPDWDRFARGNGMYLAADKAEQLGAEVGDTLVVGGRELALVGTFEPAQFGRKLRTLDDLPVTPHDYTSLSEGERQKVRNQNLEQTTDAMASGETFEPDLTLEFLDSGEIAILPGLETSHLPLQLRSIAIPCPDPVRARKVAKALIDRLAFPVYYGAEDEVHVLAAAPLVPRPPRSMLIPLAVAAMIVFNTMLNSIAERKKEIHVYTSLGLAPKHVGVLFLAEAATYGLMGSIFGFVVGQAFARAASSLGWMGGMTLNYSGTHVILTMGVVMLVVVFSAIVPALMAARLATPGKELNWHLPEPVDGVISDVLPFTVTPEAAPGVIAYLREYFDAHREGSVGNFASAEIEMFHAEPEGVEGMGVRATIWPEPYDLGVRQHVRVTVHATDAEDVCELHTELWHETGQEPAWWRLNRTFIGDLRRQLLGWRRVESAQVMRYIADACKFLGRPPVPDGE